MAEDILNDILKDMHYKISIADVFVLYEAIGFIEANATEAGKNMLFALKNVAFKVNYKLNQEEQEAIELAIKQRKDDGDL